MSGKYDDLTQAQLIELLEKRERTKKLGIVWERDEIESDHAVDENFISCEVIAELSDKSPPWSNMVIEGDNFDALRWLRMTLAGKVKCIYVDPPYNTGNVTWVYNDKYLDPEDRFRQSTWLEFLYRRFSLARDLLTEDGVIMVSINDDQRSLVELLMNEAMPGMKIGSFVWRTRTGGNEGGRHFLSSNHEHVLVFGKSAFRFCGSEKTFADYSNPDNDPRGDWQSSDLTVAVAFDDPRAGSAYYPLYDPRTDIYYPANPDRVWGYVSKKHAKPGQKIKTKYMEEWIDEDRVKFPENPRIAVWNSMEELLEAIDAGEVPTSGRKPLLRRDLPNLDFWIGKKVGFGMPRFKRLKSELKNPTQPLSSWITNKTSEQEDNNHSNFITSGTNDEGSKAIKAIFDNKAFNYAKPVSLVRELVRQSTGAKDIILDFFAGSATTAQAVMELNAEDGGERRFIMVSSTEATNNDQDKNLCNNVTAERIRRLNISEEPKFSQLAAEFAYLRTKEILFEDLDYDLSPQEAWTSLETLHGLPLTIYNTDENWNAHEGNEVTLVLVDKLDSSLVKWLQFRAKQNVFVYSWAPGQIRNELSNMDIEVLSIHETLVRNFQQ